VVREGETLRAVARTRVARQVPLLDVLRGPVLRVRAIGDSPCPVWSAYPFVMEIRHVAPTLA